MVNYLTIFREIDSNFPENHGHEWQKQQKLETLRVMFIWFAKISNKKRGEGNPKLDFSLPQM